MICTLHPDETFDRLTFDAGPDRTPGLHVSDIIQQLQQTLDQKRYAGNRFDEGTKYLYRETGFAFEDCIERAMNRRRTDVIRPPELELDGIFLSPDGYNPELSAIDEIKFTWKSERGAPESEKFWGWRVQFMAYCKALGLTRAILRAAFVNGDYKTFVPTYRVWDLRFTQQEIDANWRMLLKAADDFQLR